MAEIPHSIDVWVCPACERAHSHQAGQTASSCGCTGWDATGVRRVRATYVLAEATAEMARLRAGLVAIQCHGMLDDNAASMVWTARVALNPDAMDSVPEHLRARVAARFDALSTGRDASREVIEEMVERAAREIHRAFCNCAASEFESGRYQWCESIYVVAAEEALRAAFRTETPDA